MVNREFWKSKKVFLTGHTGFKGSWMSLWLHDLGAEVTGYSLDPPTQPSLFELGSLGEKIHSIIADIRDSKTLDEAVKACQPEIIIHMAAQPLVIASYEDPIDTYSTNVVGTANLFEAAKKTGAVRTILNVTTDKCYENKEWYWSYRENESLGGHDPYSSSKACSELLTTTYQKCFFTEKSGKTLASARAGNVIGGGDWAQMRLLPDFLRSITSGETLIVRNPQAIRPWQHVLEPLSGYLKLAEKLFLDGKKFEGAWNFGPNDTDAKPVEWIADQMCLMWSKEADWKLDDPSKEQVHEANYLKLDCSKARAELNWAPKLTLQETLKWIVEWYKAYLLGQDMAEFTRSQIRAYEAITQK